MTVKVKIFLDSDVADQSTIRRIACYFETTDLINASGSDRPLATYRLMNGTLILH
jgi:hypothetical protein